MMTMTTTRMTLTGTLVTVMMSWKTLHTQLVLRQMTQNFLNSLMAIWKTPMRPLLKCMLRQVAVFKKHVSFWLVSRVPEAIFLLLVLVLLTAWLSHPLIENLQSLVAKARRVRGKENPFLRKMENPTSPGTPGILPQPQNSHVESRPPMSKKRPTDADATRGGSNHAPRLRPDQCMLCRQVGHRASECPDKGKPTAFSPGKRAFGTYALGCAVLGSRVMVPLSKKSNKVKTRRTLKTLLRFQSRVWRCSPFLTDEPRRQFLDSCVSNQLQIDTRTPRLRRQMLALRSLAAKRSRQARTSACHMLSSRKEFR